MVKKIAVIGTGYVGIVSGAGISDFGNKVTCVDILEQKIQSLKNGIIPIYEPGLDEIVKRNVKANRLDFSIQVSETIQKSDIIFIAVGTPQAENGHADLSAIRAISKTIGENLNRYKVICTKSTVPIGTGENIIKWIKRSMKNKIEFDYVSNPEFLREGSAVKDFLLPDRVVIGASNDRAFKLMKDVYRPLYINETPMLHTNVITAEMIKYASNSFLALKISYINEVANLCDIVGADIHQVTKGMGKDGRISPKFLHPGPGFGGSCFPKDLNAFSIFSKDNGIELRTIEAAILTNLQQKIKMTNKMETLVGGSFKNKKIAVLGLAFKSNTDDVRESPAITMIQTIIDNGGFVNAFDPIANRTMKKIFPDIDYYTTWEDACKNADAVAIMTEWNEFRGMDLLLLKSLLKSAVVLDTRNILNPKTLLELNFNFDNVGRKVI
tara:strand:+ start:307 stop:1623 length:1317 start_codon:yes stop_codon:yes gene_type:complete